LGKPVERIQKHLRVLEDGAKGVAAIRSQRREPHIDGNEARPQLQKETLFFPGALLWWAGLKIPTDFTQATSTLTMQDKKALPYHFFFLQLHPMTHRRGHGLE